SISLTARIANALVSYVRYLGKMFWPVKLSVLYPHPGHWPLWEPLACTALLVVIFGAVALFGRSRPYLLVRCLWFFGTLVPVIGLIQVGVQSMADRYTYVPLIGVFIMIVWGVSELILRKSARRPDAVSKEMASIKQAGSSVNPIPASCWTLPSSCELGIWSFVIGACLLACAVLTSRQITFWRDSEALFRRAARITKNNYLAYNNLGIFLAKKGKTDEAME